MTTGVYGWSTTAASNANADSAINWAEGQAPSSINDSARAMMAVLAKYRDDISGAITTAGTSTAYTITSNSVFDTLAHMHNQIIAFVPHASNTDTNVTLNVDGLGAKPLRSAPSVELQTGALILGTPYIAFYNNTDGAFYLHGASNYNSYSIPLGGMLPYIGSTAPNSAFVLPSGQAISRTTYSTLFSLVGTTFGSGDGSTTFNVPDLRGRVWAGLDNMNGTNAGRLSSVISSSTMGASGGVQTYTLATNEIPSHSHSFSGTTDIEDAAHTHTVSYGSVLVGTGASASVIAAPGTGTPVTATSATESVNHHHLFSGTTANAGSGSSHSNTQPTIVGNYILRVI